jgi:hypothetical protein
MDYYPVRRRRRGGSDGTTFVTRHDQPNDGTSCTAVELPELPVVIVPTTVEGMELNEYRRMLPPLLLASFEAGFVSLSTRRLTQEGVRMYPERVVQQHQILLQTRLQKPTRISTCLTPQLSNTPRSPDGTPV